MALTHKERLKRFYEQFSKEDRVLMPIIADPDAMACAMAVKRLLWRKIANVTIANINEIKRTDNLAMIRLLGVPMVPFRKVGLKDFNRMVLVDCQPGHHADLAGMEPHVIIDHHPPDPAAKAPFMDVRPNYGATATIMVEYLRTAKIKPSVKLATGLYYAIKTDTANFERQTQIEDLHAFQYIFKHANIYLAARIEQAEMRIDFLKYFKQAIEDRTIRNNHIFVHLGRVPNPDICVQVADFFMRVDSITWSVVSGLHQNKLVVILRNDGIRKNAGAVVKKSFGQWGQAGGHKCAARAEVPVEAIASLVDCSDRKKTGKWIITQMTKRANPKK